MAEIQEFLSPEARRQVKEYITDIKELAGLYSKLAKESIATNRAQANSVSKLTEEQKENNRIAREREKLEKRLDNLRKGVLDDTIKLREAVRKETYERKVQSNEYMRLSIRLKRVKDELKALAVQGKRNTEEFRKLNTEFKDLDKRIRDADESFGDYQRKVGEYTSAFDKIKGVVGKASIAIAGITTAIGAVAGAISSVVSWSQKWEATMTGMKAGMSRFLLDLKEMRFSIDRITDSYTAAKQAALVFAQSGVLEESFEARRWSIMIEMEAMRQIIDDEKRTYEERMKARTKFFELSAELAEATVKHSKFITTQYANMVTAARGDSRLLFDIITLSQDEIQEYVDAYSKLDELRKKGEEYVVRPGMTTGTTVFNINLLNEEQRKLYEQGMKYKELIDIIGTDGLETVLRWTREQNDALEDQQGKNSEILNTKIEQNKATERQVELLDEIKSKTLDIAPMEGSALPEMLGLVPVPEGVTPLQLFMANLDETVPKLGMLEGALGAMSDELARGGSSWESFGEVVQSVLRGLIAQMISALALSAALALITGGTSSLTFMQRFVASLGKITGFAEGTESTPSTPWVAGEAGPELIELRSGREFIVDKPTLFQDEPGAKVTPVATASASVNIDKYGIITIAEGNRGRMAYIGRKFRN